MRKYQVRFWRRVGGVTLWLSLIVLGDEGEPKSSYPYKYLYFMFDKLSDRLRITKCRAMAIVPSNYILLSILRWWVTGSDLTTVQDFRC